MAADGVNKLNILLVYGNNRIDTLVTLPEDETGDVITVKHLADTVAAKTEVPVCNQKLIFKGKSLTDPSAGLVALGMKNGCKVMLIGKKFNAEDDSHMQRMNKVGDDVTRTEKKLSDVIYEIDGIHRGYLAHNLQEQALNELTKRLGGVMEDLTRHLETLDALVLGESASEVRLHRKSIVTKVQGLLERCDGVQCGLNEMLTKLANK